MTPDRWREIQEVMLATLSAVDRQQFLDQRCAEDKELRAEVENLLDAHDEAEDDWLESQESPLSDIAAHDAEGHQIGRYRLAEKLGSGGMGEVFLAHRSDDSYSREVAIKILRPGVNHPGIRSRFRAERQILASITHPNIAQLIDGGETASGQPYLVMELVEGQPIDSYCDEHLLSIRQRLELFCKVCDAVEEAHRSLVVHRDLKPSNILVSAQGEPKLLDFGIAKILDPASFDLDVNVTETGLTPMTPRYASPEQVRGQAITTATDVYSLGVLLYELLCGVRPYEFNAGSLDSMIQAICHAEPTRPSNAHRKTWPPKPQDTTIEAGMPRPASRSGVNSPLETVGQTRGIDARTLRRQLSGDLDAIVLKALRKDPVDRYRSVGQLADDIRRHFNSRPVRAHRGSLGYTASKFVRRHRLAVGSLAAFVTILLLFINALLHERRETAAQRDRFVEVAGLLLELFELPNPSRSRGRSTTAQELLDKGAKSLETRLTEQPEVKAHLQGILGESFAGLGLFDEAIELLRSSVELYESLGLDTPEMAMRRKLLAENLARAGFYEQAQDQANRAVRAHRRLHGDGDPTVVQSLVSLATILTFRGLSQEAHESLSEAENLARTFDDRETLAKVLDQLAVVETKLGNYDNAERLAREAVDLTQQLFGELHPTSAQCMLNLASAIREHQPKEAEALLRRTLNLQQRLFDDVHPDIALTLDHLGRLLWSMLGDRAPDGEAAQLLEKALAMNRELYGDSHPLIGISLRNIADMKTELKDFATAEQLYRESISILELELGAENPEVATSHNNYATVLFSRRDFPQAKFHLEAALASVRHVLGEEHPQVADMMSNAASLARQAGDYKTAIDLRLPAIEIIRRKLGRDHPTLGVMLYNQAKVHMKLGDFEQAVKLATESLPIRRLSLGDDHLAVGQQTANLASWQHELGAFKEAEKLAGESLRIFQISPPKSPGWTARSQRILGTSQMRQGRLKKAEPELLKYLSMIEASESLWAPNAATAYSLLYELYELYELSGEDDRAAEIKNKLESLPAED